MSVQAVVAQMLGDPGAAFDVRSFPTLGSPGDDIAVCLVSRASGIDLAAWRAGKARPRLGMTNYGAMSHTAASLFAEGLHLPLRPVVGYKGTSDIRMAIASGEIDGTCVGADAYLASFEPRSSYTILLQAADNDIPELAGVPSASHLVSDDDGRDLLDVLNLMGTAFALLCRATWHAGRPDDAVARSPGRDDARRVVSSGRRIGASANPAVDARDD